MRILQNVAFHSYPVIRPGTSIAASLVPRWAMAGGRDMMLDRFEDEELGQKVRTEMAENLRRRGGAGSLLLVGGKETWKGHTLSDMAEHWEVSAIEAALRIVREGDSPVASFNMDEADIANFMKEDWVMTGSDGSTGHPRKYGSFPEKFRKYVRDREVIDLPTFIRRSSGLAADTFNLVGRGYIRTGYKADIVVFDPEIYAAKATYQDPEALSVGVQYLFVNGQLVINAGEAVPGIYAGQTIRNQGQCAP